MSHESVDSSDIEMCMCPDIPNLLRAAGASNEQAEMVVETSSTLAGDIQRVFLSRVSDA